MGLVGVDDLLTWDEVAETRLECVVRYSFYRLSFVFAFVLQGLLVLKYTLCDVLEGVQSLFYQLNPRVLADLKYSIVTCYCACPVLGMLKLGMRILPCAYPALTCR